MDSTFVAALVTLLSVVLGARFACFAALVGCLI